MGVPFLLLGLTLAVTCIAALRVERAVEEQERSRFADLAQSAYQALAASVEYDLNAVRSLQGLFHSRGVVGPEEWTRFVASLNWRRNYPNQLDLGYARRIVGTNGAPDQFVIVHLDSKLKGNSHEVGVDLMQQPGQRETLERAADNSAPISSPVVNLCVPTSQAYTGIVVYLPVYEGGRASRVRAERRASLAGYVFNSSVITNYYRSVAVGRTNQMIRMTIEEAPVEGGVPRQGRSPIVRTEEGYLESVLTTIGIGRYWSIRFTSLPAFSAESPRHVPWVVAGVGTVFSLLVFGLTAAQARGRSRADRLNLELRNSEEAIQRLNKDLEQRIEERTAELVTINARLQTEIAERQRTEAALREIEQLYRRAIASADAVPYRRDYATESFTFIGEGIEKLTGYTAAEMTPQLWESLVEESSLQGELAGLPVDEAVRRVRAGEFSRWRDDCRIRMKDGSIRWICDSSVEILSEGQKPTGSVGFLMDITERKRAEEELVKALALEKELGRLKGNFVSTVSHEFRTPLGIIMSSAEILDRYFDRLAPQARRDQLTAIHQAVQRMAGLMENVLVLSGAEAGRLAFHPAPLSLAAFCARLVEEVQTASPGCGPIEFEPTGLPAEATGDENLLRHIFINLLGNAVKYSPAGSPVKLRVRQEGGNAVFEVVDRGIGIPQDDRDRLFMAFHRGANVGHISGTGLGLSIVKRCVELHGGRIRFEGGPGGGTMFTVVLPLFGVRDG
jgi:PAS domain S-box-containing protein